MIDYPNELNIIFDKLNDNNAKPIIVGGYVRDKLLKIDSKDIDIEVYGIKTYEELEAILSNFGQVNSVGKSFGVCKLHLDGLELDFSLPRSDNKISSGHRGFNISINPNLDFKTAASRRDFTINAIGYDVINKKIIDPFDGAYDLKNRVLKAVDLNKFSEDPLRVFRAAQFCARFELKVDNELISICKDLVSYKKTDELPKERIFEEIKKLILKAKKPSIGFNFLKKVGSDIYTENIYLLDEISKQLTIDKKTNIVLMLAAMCYNFNEDNTNNFLAKLTNEKDIIKRVLSLTSNLSRIDTTLDDYELLKLAVDINIKELLILSSSIYYYKNPSKAYVNGDNIYKRAKELNILTSKTPEILKGEDILKSGLKPSPKFSEILNNAYDAQIRGEFHTHPEALKWLERYLQAHF